MMKFLKGLLALCLAISLCACSSSSNKEETKKEEEKQDAFEQEKSELEAIGDVEVDKGILYVSITVPATLAGEEVTQEELDKEAGENYTSAKLNSDGSVTYKMTRAQHKSMLKEITDGFDESIQELIEDEDYSIVKVEHDKAFKKFDITIDGEELGFVDAFSVIIFYMYGGLYGIFNGNQDKVVVNYYSNSGELIESYDSSNLSE